MKMVLFVGEVSAEGLSLMEMLKQQGFNCPRVSLPDEIDQAGKQSEYAVLVFTGTKVPHQFLTENRWPFRTFNVLYLASKPNLTADIQKTLDRVKLNVFYIAKNNELIKDIESFITAKSQALDEIEEIKFSVHDELGKEHDK